MEENKAILKWLDAHPAFKPSTMCLDLGINVGNFSGYRKNKQIPEKYIAAIEGYLRAYGYAPDATPPPTKKARKTGTKLPAGLRGIDLAIWKSEHNE